MCNNRCSNPYNLEFTHIVSPGNLVGPGISFDGALEVHVVTLLDVGGVQAGPQGQGGAGYIYKGLKSMSY